MTKLFGHFGRKEFGAWNLFSVGAVYFLQLAIQSHMSVFACKLRIAPQASWRRCSSAGFFKERTRERERESEGGREKESYRLVSVLHSDVNVHEYHCCMCTSVCVVVFVLRVHVAEKHSEIEETIQTTQALCTWLVAFLPSLAQWSWDLARADSKTLRNLRPSSRHCSCWLYVCVHIYIYIY